MGDNSTTSNGGLDKLIQLFITTDSQLQMTRVDTLLFQVLGGVTGQLQHFSAQIFKNRSTIDSSSGTYAATTTDTLFEVAMNTTNRELKTSTS